MKLILDPSKLEDYETFLKVKRLPIYRICGRQCEFPDEYASLLGVKRKPKPVAGYEPLPGMFDYQEGISTLAIRKRKFGVFVRPGYGKTLIMLEFARHARRVLPKGKRVLMLSPLMVIEQTLDEAKRFYGCKLAIDQVEAKDFARWTTGRGGIGITNYESLKDTVPQGNLGAIAGDELSTIKSHYGKWATEIIRLGRGLEWKQSLTGTPAPNDRIEYANHAVFLDAFPTVNSFLARFFINRGQTNERWEMKPHALAPFYRSLSHWCFFMSNPATYGWKDNAGTIPPIYVHVHDVDLTDRQKEMIQTETKSLYGDNVGGITSRSKLGQISKGGYKGEKIATNKTAFIRSLVDSWPDESTIIWCIYNAEQSEMERAFPDAASIKGETPYSQRKELIESFKSGRKKVIISKAGVLGFGLNLQIATRQVFSGCEDSYEEFTQCVHRSNRVGSTRPLNVHLPVTEAERPMMDNVLRKSKMVQEDTEVQEKLFAKELNSVVA